jgi:O-antigen ligase
VNKMKKYLVPLIYSLFVSLIIISIMYATHYSNDKFILKGAIFAGIIIIYITIITRLKSDYVVLSLIFVAFLDVPIKQLYTSTTNIFIVIALGVLFIRYAIDKNAVNIFTRIRKNSATLPLILIICSYTFSLITAKKDMGEHFIIYHSIICAAVMAWMIIGTVREKSQIAAINTIMLTGLLLNLCFSLIFIFFPGIDSFRAKLLSLAEIPDEAESIIQGLSFRGEAYGEYLMLCGLWLFLMLVRGQFARGKTFAWIVTAATVTALIMTQSRGANAIFFIGAILILLTSRSVQLWKKAAAFMVMALFISSALFVMKTYSGESTLLDRFYEFTDTSRNVGYIPETRYYTWAPSVQVAISQHFMGGGPSFVPYVTETEWQKIVADQASGDLTTWPHNIILLIVCTVGIYGLTSYLFLVIRAVRLRKGFGDLDPYLGACYSGYFICFVMFLIEAQKFDGFLRHPSSSFYFIFTLIALLFSCENMTGVPEKNTKPSRKNRNFN